MAIRILFIMLLILSLFIETTLISFPLFVFFSILFFFFSRQLRDALIIFFLGFVLDAARVAPFGFTSLYLSLTFLLLGSDASFFNIQDVWFFAFLVFVVTVLYGFLSGYSFIPVFYIVFVGGFMFAAVILTKWFIRPSHIEQW